MVSTGSARKLVRSPSWNCGDFTKAANSSTISVCLKIGKTFIVYRHHRWRLSDIVLRFTEIFELSSRLTFTAAGDEGLRVDIKVDNIHDHLLILPGYGSGKASWIPEAHKKYMHHKTDVSKIELVADRRELALTSALKLFDCFKWSPDIELLRDLQEQMVRKGPVVV